MIFTRVKIDNLYCFNDTELDLTYSRMLKISSIEDEYIPTRPNFKFKRICIISGANASGKSSLGRLLMYVQNFIHRPNTNSYIFDAVSYPDKEGYIEVEFTFPEIEKPKLYNLEMKINQKLDLNDRQPKIRLTSTNINKSSSVRECRNKIKNLKENEKFEINSFILDDTTSILNENFKLSKHLSSQEMVWNFEIKETSNIVKSSKLNQIKSQDKDILQKILCAFDPSIDRITESKDEDKEVTNFNIHFKNKKTAQIDINGNLTSRPDLLSMGTAEAIRITSFILNLRDLRSESGVYYLDEQFAHSHSNLERAIINLIIQHINRYSQFFYTTHNYDIFEMNLPTHSFVFTKRNRDNSVEFIKPEQVFKKNDRIKNDILKIITDDYFNLMPSTSLIEDLLWDIPDSEATHDN